MAILNPAAFESFVRDPTGPINRHLERIADKTKALASAAIPRSDSVDPRAGAHLADVIQTRKEGFFWIVEAPLRHATIHHQGSKPHVIRARNSSAMAFFWPRVGALTFVPKTPSRFNGFRGGVYIIGKGFVRHPGTEANPYLVDSLRQAVQSS